MLGEIPTQLCNLKIAYVQIPYFGELDVIEAGSVIVVIESHNAISRTSRRY